MTRERFIIYPPGDIEGKPEIIEGDDSPQGCFGHSVMLGTRRRNTVIASELSELLVDAREAAWRRLAAVVVATAAAAADARAACWGTLDARYLRLPHRLHRCAAPNPRLAHAAPKTVYLP